MTQIKDLMEIKTKPYFLMGLLLPGSVSKPSFLCSYSNEEEGRGPPVTVLTQSYPGATLQTNLLTRLQDKTESRSELQETTGN